jgi:cytochrome c biogenesis protein CcdA/thiol-disulfide isomerase/thioredoxin
MILAVLAYLGGVLTILSPCILPVVPFVFAQSDQPFRRSGLPLLAGMVVTFAVLSSLATIGGSWIVTANQYGRIAALVLMAGFGITLLSERVATIASRPFVALGARLADRQSTGNTVEPSIRRAVLLGVATGLLWTPCAGPILGLILTGAAYQHSAAQSIVPLLTYAAGAATALAIVLKAGSRLSQVFRRSLGAEAWLRRGLGVAVLAGVAAIALGFDRTVLTQLTPVDTAGLEQNLLDRFGGPTANPTAAKTSAQRVGQAEKSNVMAMTGNAAPAMMMSSTHTTNSAGGNAMMSSSSQAMSGSNAMTGNQAPAMMAMIAAPQAVAPAAPSLLDFTGAVSWLNSPPLTAAALKGKVVLVDFWTYSCINCLRSLPYIRAWADRYKDQGLVVVGVHAPEFAFERDEGNVRQAVKDLAVDYPVAIDNNYAVWQAFGNQFWPAHYIFDATGKLRYHHFGEGKYSQTEMVIQGLLAEAKGQKGAPLAAASPELTGRAAAADDADLKSPETYIGYARASGFAAQSDGAAASLVQDRVHDYALPSQPALNEWGLGGQWQVSAEQAQLAAPSGHIVFKFHARDLNLVLGPSVDAKPIAFRVLLDGKAPGDAHGVDSDADGRGTVTGHRLYQLIRQDDAAGKNAQGAGEDHVFEIEFEDAGVQAYAFTFG